MTSKISCGCLLTRNFAKMLLLLVLGAQSAELSLMLLIESSRLNAWVRRSAIERVVDPASPATASSKSLRFMRRSLRDNTNESVLFCAASVFPSESEEVVEEARDMTLFVRVTTGTAIELLELEASNMPDKVEGVF